MTSFPFEVEVRLIRWSESSTAGRTITIELPTDQGEAHPFRGLATGHQNGQRFRMSFTPVADDEQLVAEQQPLSPKSPVVQTSVGEQARVRSVMLAKDPKFWKWLSIDSRANVSNEEQAAYYIRNWCNIRSRRELVTNPDALDRYLRLETTYLIWRDYPSQQTSAPPPVPERPPA